MRIKPLLLAAAIGVASVANANVAEDMNAGIGMQQVIINGVNSGLKMDEIIQQAVEADPARAPDLVTAALMMLPVLPPSVCTGLPFRENHESTRNRQACMLLILQTAVDAGGDPAAVQDAASDALYGAVSIDIPGSPPGPDGNSRGGNVSPFR